MYEYTVCNGFVNTTCWPTFCFNRSTILSKCQHYQINSRARL